MTNEEFEAWLRNEFNKYPLLARNIPHTINELVYVLRHSGLDFDLSFREPNGDGWACIPSVRECFIPVRDLALHIENIEYEEDEYENELYRHLELEVTK